MRSSEYTTLVYQPNSYTRRGPPETCMQIVRQYPVVGLEAQVMLVRARVSVPDGVEIVEVLPWILRKAPWKLIGAIGIEELNRQFVKRLRKLDPEKTIVVIWPGWPIPALETARKLGFTLVREMINTTCAVSKPILDAAYARQKLLPSHNVSAELVAAETEELQLYDHMFSPSAEVDRSLRAIGIPDDRILQSSFGWNPARFAASQPAYKEPGRLRFLFVGSIGVRKGVPELLDAWKQAAIPDAELLLVGNIEPDFADLYAATLPDGVQHIAFSSDIAGYYKSSDVFVFPSHEEGAPQVVYEAAGCGLAVITTPMGTARLIEDAENGLVIPPADACALAAAMRRLAEDHMLRDTLRSNAAESAKAFEYPLVGQERGRTLRALLEQRIPRREIA